MTSTSFINGTGFMKCMPMTCSGRLVAAAILVMRDGGGVGGQDRSGLASRSSSCEDLELEVGVFGGGLDDHVGLADRVEVVRAMPSAASFCSSVMVPLPASLSTDSGDRLPGAIDVLRA